MSMFDPDPKRVRELREEREIGLVEAKRIAKGEAMLSYASRLDPNENEDRWRMVEILQELIKDVYGD